MRVPSLVVLLFVSLGAHPALGESVDLVGRTVAVVSTAGVEGRIVEFNLEGKVPSGRLDNTLLKQEIWPLGSQVTGSVVVEVLQGSERADEDSLRMRWAESSFPDTMSCPRGSCHEMQLDITRGLADGRGMGAGVVVVLLKADGGVSLGEKRRPTTRMWVTWSPANLGCTGRGQVWQFDPPGWKDVELPRHPAPEAHSP